MRRRDGPPGHRVWQCRAAGGSAVRDVSEVDRPYWPSRRQSIAIALQVFVANHLVLAGISLLTGRLFYDIPRKTPYTLAALWHHWDVLWYLDLADHGYHWYAPP